MAHHKSAKKRIKTNEKRRLYNRSIRSRVRTYTRYIFEAIEAVEKVEDKAALRPEVEEKFRKFVSEYQKAVSKGVFVKNTASRKISRMSAAMNKAFA